MALFRITAKKSVSSSGVKLEKGMSIEVSHSSSSSNPFVDSKGKLAVRDAFLRVYGIDINASSSLSSSGNFEVEKLS